MGIETFQDILLEDTFVHSWERSGDELTFSVLASLQATHPQASAPDPGEWACYRPAAIVFTGVESVAGLLPQSSVRAKTDPDGTIDYGGIDFLSQVGPGEYRIAGEFGVVSVVARDVSLAFAERSN